MDKFQLAQVQDSEIEILPGAQQFCEQVSLSLDDVVKINEAAELMGCTVESLLRQAANDERLLYVALTPHSQTLSAIPSHPAPLKGSSATKGLSIVAMMPHYAESLAVIEKAEICQYQAGFEPPLDWHYWMLDVPQTVGVDRVFVPRSQLPADAPAAKVEARVPVARQQDNAILNWLKSNKHNPLRLPVPPSGKAGVKKQCRDELCKNQKPLFLSTRVFNTAWDRLRGNTEISDAQ